MYKLEPRSQVRSQVISHLTSGESVAVFFNPSSFLLCCIPVFMHQSIPPAPSPPPGYCGAFARLVSPGGWGICKFCTARGPGICQPPGHSRAFDTHAVSYQNITTQKVLLEKKQIGSSVKDRNKLLIKPELHSEIGAIDVNQRFLVIESNFC